MKKYLLSLRTREETAFLNFKLCSQNLLTIYSQLRWKVPQMKAGRNVKTIDYSIIQTILRTTVKFCGKKNGMLIFLRIYCFASSINFQRRQMYQLNVYINLHIIMTVRLKNLSKRHLYFMWTNRSKRLERQRLKLSGERHWYQQILIPLPPITMVCLFLLFILSRSLFLVFIGLHSGIWKFPG